VATWETLPLGGRPVRSLGDGQEDGKEDFWLALRRRHGRAGRSTERSVASEAFE